jgi:hypothetical protein
MVFVFEEMKNIAMPSRHISPQSFDTILSELGDDPAIPDPHGIRKPSSSKGNIPGASKPAKTPSFLEPLSQPDLINQVKKMGAVLVVVLCFVGLIFGLFLVYDSSKSTSDTQLEDSNIQILKLQTDLAIIRKELDEDFNSPYEEIDLLKVSIHTLDKKKSNYQVLLKPKPYPHESELRSWRYLGNSQMGDIQQAFFQQGKFQTIFSKGALVVGEWRLTHIEKEGATLSHPQGKSIVLHPTKSE